MANDGQFVDVNTLARFWGVDERTVQLYADEKHNNPPLPREARGKYDFVKAMKWMYERQKKRIEILETSGDEKLHQLRMKGQIIKNKRDEISLKRELGTLIEKRTALIVWSNQINIIKNQLLQLKFDLMRDLEESICEEERTETQKIIEENFAKSLETIAELEVERYLKDEEKLAEEE